MQTLDLLWLELTPVCNLECVHCYAESSPKSERITPLTEDDYRRLIKEASRLSCERVQFIGGEPTLSPFLTSLIDYSRDCDIRHIEVFTNATRLSKSLIQSLKRNQASVNVSFYSANPEVHDKVTQKHGSHAATTLGLRKLLSADIKTSVSIIEMGDNQAHINETKLYLNDLGITNIHIDYHRQIGRGAGTKQRFVNNGTTKLELSESYNRNNLKELCGNCGVGMLAVLPNGDVSPCVMSRQSVIGSVRHHSLKEVLASSVLSDFRIQLAKEKSPVNLNSERSPQCSPNHNPSPAPERLDPERSPQCSPNHNPSPVPERLNPERSPQCSPNHNPSPAPERLNPERSPQYERKVPEKLLDLFKTIKLPLAPTHVEIIGERSEIFMFEMLPPTVCDQIVSMSSKMTFNSSKMSGSNEADYRTSTNVFLRKYGDELQFAFDQSILPFLSKITEEAWEWNCNVSTDVAIIKYEPGRFYKEHIDAGNMEVFRSRHVSFLIYLSDTFKGGETKFRRQSVTIRPKKGYGVVFPSGITHPHEALPVLSGVKHVLVGWLTRI